MFIDETENIKPKILIYFCHFLFFWVLKLQIEPEPNLGGANENTWQFGFRYACFKPGTLCHARQEPFKAKKQFVFFRFFHNGKHF